MLSPTTHHHAKQIKEALIHPSIHLVLLLSPKRTMTTIRDKKFVVSGFHCLAGEKANLVWDLGQEKKDRG